MDTQEQQRFAAIRAGNEQAFESLFREHYAVLCAFSRKFVTDPDAAEEIVQDLFLGLWEKRADLMPTLSLRSYLFAAVRNSCLNHLKHLKVRGRHVERVTAAACASAAAAHWACAAATSRSGAAAAGCGAASHAGASRASAASAATCRGGATSRGRRRASGGRARPSRGGPGHRARVIRRATTRDESQAQEQRKSANSRHASPCPDDTQMRGRSQVSQCISAERLKSGARCC